MKIGAIVCACGAVAGMAYYALSLVAVRRFARRVRAAQAPSQATFTPPVSILKPLRGIDPGIYDAFRSHCEQDYPEYELIFGVSEADDPAADLVRKLMAEFPQREIKLLVCEQILGTNVKVSNLAQTMRQARYEHLIVNDSDVRVSRDYLRRVMAPFADDSVGMVTCLYRGVAEETFGSRLEALGISTDFAAGVITAEYLEGVKFGLGATLAFTRTALTQIGGFESLLDYLADDYELGARIAAIGKKIVLSDVVVETHLPRYFFREFLDHQMRWARTIRDSRRWGYVGLVFTFGVPWALGALFLSRFAAWAWVLLGLTLALRLALARAVGGKLLKDLTVRTSWWLIPLRDVIGLGVWAWSFAGHTVRWRGTEFLLKDGKLRPA